MSFKLGEKFVLTVYGESHGESVGVIVEGCKPGLKIDLAAIQKELDRRRPGSSGLTSQRREKDRLEVASGIKDGTANGGPINMFVRNIDVDSSFYDEIKDKIRPGHADYTARVKYNEHHDHRGGGFFSGRMTAAFVMAGAVAKQILADEGIKVLAHIVRIGKIAVEDEIGDDDIETNVYSNDVRCADPLTAKKMEGEIINARSKGDSVGGVIECRVIGLPPGIGEPLFESVESVLSRAVFSIPAVKGVEFGSGFESAEMYGSHHNDPFIIKNKKIVTETNNAGGILGGLSNGMPIIFRVAVKPTPSISKPQRTVDLGSMEECEISIKGRHDPCIAVRAVTVVESMAAVSILDLYMRSIK